MVSIRQLLIFLIWLSAAWLAQAANDSAGETANRKLLLSQRTWSPIFAAIDLEKESEKPQLTKQEFQRVNELFYRAYAEYLEEPELVVMEKMYRTSVGKKIADNMFRSLFGLQTFNLTYANFSKKEKDEWESFAKENYSQVKLIENKMKGFARFIQGRLFQKKTSPAQGNEIVNR